jgi:Tol biopolymer transport system component
MFAASNASRNDLMMVDVDGSGLTTIAANAIHADWSPDGQEIVYSGFDSMGLSELYTVHLDGTGLTQLTQNPGRGQICLH